MAHELVAASEGRTLTIIISHLYLLTVSFLIKKINMIVMPEIKQADQETCKWFSDVR